MGFNFLEPQTESGKRVVNEALALTEALRSAAHEADKTSAMPVESYDVLQESGIAAAFVPEELGGGGLESIHDWLALIAALARGDGSVAIAINMHLAVSRGMAQAWRAAVAAGRDGDGAASPLRAITAKKMLICATATERGTDNLHPLTEAVAADGGWCVNGTKMFVTMSPIATHLGMNLRMRDEKGDHLVTTLMPVSTPGIRPLEDWDALGMRGSGSQSVAFENVQLKKSTLRRLGPWGEWSAGVLLNRTLGNLPLVAAFLGIAEHAYEIARDAIGKQRRVDHALSEEAGVQHMFGEMTIELAKCRAMLAAAGADLDKQLNELAGKLPSVEAAHQIMADYQCAKTVVNKGAIDIVNRAMDVCGGGAYMNVNTLSRLYRDVRAGPFMQPYSPAELTGYVGKVAAGDYPNS